MTGGPRCILLVPGLAKAGTTFLFEQLARQPDLFSPTRSKELNYFSRPRERSREDYLSRFLGRAAAGRILVDISPGYLEAGPVIPTRVRELLPEDGITALILLRDPVDAFVSHYLHDMKSTIGRPSWTGARPATYALDQPAVMARYLRPRAPAAAAWKARFGEGCRGAYMGALFDGGVAEMLRAMLGVAVRDLAADQVSNPGGFVPGYLWGGADGLTHEQDGIAWRIPPGAMVFAANERSELHHGVPPDGAEALIRLGRSFTSHIALPLDALRPAIEDHVGICRALGIEPRVKPRGAVLDYTAPQGRISPAVLERLERA